MSRLPLVALRFVALALAASSAIGCSDQESEPDNGYHPIVMTDSDRDGIPDQCEAFFGTDPNKADTDNDALADGSEDADGDGYTNYQEMKPYADKGKCPPETDGGKEAAADSETPDAADDAETDGQTGDANEPDAEADVLLETGGDAEPASDASDAEATDSAAE